MTFSFRGKETIDNLAPGMMCERRRGNMNARSSLWSIGILLVFLLANCAGATNQNNDSTDTQSEQSSSSQADSSGDDSTGSDSDSSGSDDSGSTEQDDGSQNGGDVWDDVDQKRENLPDISSFLTTPSDRFYVDFDDMADGIPYMGENVSTPNKAHAGLHIYFSNNGEIPEGSSVQSYPPVYAIADGVVTSVSPYGVQKTGNIQYSILMEVARDDGESIAVVYSLEPFIVVAEGTLDDFILVEAGQEVKKGDVIAYMYTPVGSNNAHIHSHFSHSQKGMMVPAIFSRDVVDGFLNAITSNRFPTRDSETENCMGYDIVDHENPFSLTAADCI